MCLCLQDAQKSSGLTFDSDSENESEDDHNSSSEPSMSSESDCTDSESEYSSTHSEGGVHLLQTVDGEHPTQNPVTITIDASKFRVSKYE